MKFKLSKVHASVLVALIVVAAGFMWGEYVQTERERVRSFEAPREMVEPYLAINAIGEGMGTSMKTFCDYDTLDAEVVGDVGVHDSVVKQYVWLYCQQYGIEGGSLVQGTGASLPAVLTIQKSGSGYSLIGYKGAYEGGLDGSANRELFSKRALRKARTYEGHASHLDPADMARAYYGIK